MSCVNPSENLTEMTKGQTQSRDATAPQFIHASPFHPQKIWVNNAKKDMQDIGKPMGKWGTSGSHL